MGKLVGGLVLSAVVSVQSEVQVALRDGARLEQAGDTAGALESYNLALGESRPGSHDRGDALVALAGLETVLGKYQEGRAHAREAAAIFSTLGDPRSRANALNQAGLASLYKGDYGEAEQALRSAVELSSTHGDPEGRAEQLGNLANVQFFVGRYADAARLYDEALSVTARSASDAWAARRRRILLANQASLYQRLGRDQQALDVYQKLGASSTELRPVEQAQLLTNLGVLYRHLGDPIKALSTYDTARELFARDRHVDGELGVLKNRGIVLVLDLGRLDEAERSFTDALSAATKAGNRREMLHARLYRGETLRRAGEKSRAREDFARALELARELRTPEEEWKALYGIGRTKAGEPDGVEYLKQAVTTIESIRENIRVPSLRSDFLNDKREVYDSLLAARLTAGPPAEIFNLLERSHSREWRERLGLSGSVDLASVQRALPNGVLLLDYWNSPLGSAVIAVTRDRVAVLRVDVDQAQVTGLIDSLSAAPSAAWQSFGSAVSRLLPPPDWFDGVDHVIIVPDGAVALVPFELLTVGDQLVIERAAVSYTPTAVALLRAPSRVSSLRSPWRLQLRAFGDPVFASATLDDVAPLRAHLSATGDEVRAIASELAGRAELHLGANNLKARLLAQDARAPLLHLATHAMADTHAMEQSRILFSSPSGADSLADYLFLKEAYELPLEGVELAVLSACDTARGQLVRGEGVQSFSRAFLAAGARSTVTTLWRVADRPTLEFMKIFYHHLQQGLPRDEALRRAKRRFLSSGSSLAHPHYWAAFVLTGDAIRNVPRALAWNVVILPLILLGGLAILAVRRMRRAHGP